MSEKDIEFIKNNYKTMSIDKMAEKCNSSYTAVSRIMRDNKLRKSKEYVRLSKAQIDYITKNHSNMSCEEIADHLKLEKQKVWTCINKVKKESEKNKVGNVKYDEKILNKIKVIFNKKSTFLGRIKVDFKLLLNLARIAKAKLITLRKDTLDKYYIVELIAF